MKGKNHDEPYFEKDKCIEIICTSNRDDSSITIGKVYEAKYIFEKYERDWGTFKRRPMVYRHYYEFIDDRGEKVKYETNCFVTRAEWREQQMDSIINVY
jgi:hypothetical protein